MVKPLAITTFKAVKSLLFGTAAERVADTTERIERPKTCKVVSEEAATPKLSDRTSLSHCSRDQFFKPSESAKRRARRKRQKIDTISVEAMASFYSKLQPKWIH